MKTLAYAAKKAGGKLEQFEYDLGPIKHDEVEIKVIYCGICHSDLHMLKNEWGITEYPFVPGHEIIGKISAKGDTVTHLDIGQYVGVGWRSHSCMSCYQCISGHHNLCEKGEDTIVARHGGFSDTIRCQGIWAFPIPNNLNIKTLGPLFCGGITVFSPLIINNIQPTDSVAVVGIGGLGHLALKFLKAWGCDITAISTSPDKIKEAMQFGANNFIVSNNTKELKSSTNRFKMILVTSNVNLDWNIYVNLLSAGGKLHIVGAVDKIVTDVFPLISFERSIGGSPTGNPAMIRDMLNFCDRHKIEPMIEEFSNTKVNEAFEHLESNKARYRIVLKNDFR